LAREILREKSYHTFDIPKKGTKEVRTIEAPNETLKLLQKRALEALEIVEVSRAAHGFVKGRSNATAAAEAARKLGVAKATVVGLDMRKAFPSISRERVRSLWKANFDLTGWQLHTITRMCCKEGRLATGSPISPHILNLCAKSIDEKLIAWTKKRGNGGLFLRYADDLILIVYSHKAERIKKARKALKKAVLEAGFTPHPEKHYVTKIGVNSTHAEIVGAMVSNDEVTASKKFRNKKRGLLRQIKERALKALFDPKIKKLKERILGMQAYEIHLTRMPKVETNRKLRYKTVTFGYY
jgi:hypothetical protein